LIQIKALSREATMYTAVTAARFDSRDVTVKRSTTQPDTRLVAAALDGVRLAQENERLRQVNDDLVRAAETWIRLYEAALDRANAAEARLRSAT
jgi:hypothetical protein